MNSATAYPCIGPRISVLRISMASVPCNNSPGFCSAIGHLPDAEVRHRLKQFFVLDPGFAPTLAPPPPHRHPRAAEAQQEDNEEARNPGCHRNVNGEHRHDGA